MTDNVVESRIHINVSSEGEKSVKKALDDLIGSEKLLREETAKVIKIRESQERQLESEARKLDAVYNLRRKIETTETRLGRAAAGGLGGTETFQVAAAGLEVQRRKLQEFTGAINDNTKVVQLNRANWANLSQQLQDIFVMTASGMSPITTLIQQGPQIADVFSQKGKGAGAALIEFGLGLTRLATHPITLFVGAAAAATAAVYQWQKGTDALTLSLNGLGRSSGLTMAGANRIASMSAGSSGLSVGASRGLAAQFLSAGTPGSALGGALGITKQFGRKLGMTNEDAATTLGGALNDPGRGAEELAKKFGLLSLAQREEIMLTDALGDRSGAASKLIDAVAKSLKDLEDPTYSVTREWERLKNFLSDSASAVGSFFLGGDSRTVSLEDERRKQAAEDKARRALEISSLDRGIVRQRGLDQVAKDAQLAAREITAQTYAEREAIIADRERAEILRDTANVTKTMITAEGERLKLLLQSQRAVQDYVRAGQQERSLLGKTPFQRGLQDIENRYQDLSRNLPGGGAGGLTAASRSGNARLSELARRGLAPTEENFNKLIAEGVGGQGAFTGRLLPPSALSTNVDMGGPSGAAIGGAALQERAAQRAAFVTEAQRAPLRELTKDLGDQERMLQLQADAFFKSAGAVAEAAKKQELYNMYGREGIPVTAEMATQIDALAAKQGQLAEESERVIEQQNRLREAISDVKNIASESLSTFVDDMRRGVGVGNSLKNVLEGIERTALKIAEKTLTRSLFGEKENGSDGLLGGLFSGIFGGGSSSGIGGFFSGLFGGGGGGIPAAPFAMGGIMTGSGPMRLRKYAGGGVANSPQLAMFGEGSRPEAYVPLPDGRRIPVAMESRSTAGNQSGGVTIHNYAAGVEVQPQVTPQGVQIMIRSALDQFSEALPRAISDSRRLSNA